MKKLISLLLFGAMLFSFASCSNTPQNDDMPTQPATPTESVTPTNASSPTPTPIPYTYKFLMLGNSQTFHNDVPKLFTMICASKGVSVEVDSVTRGGIPLSTFFTDTALNKELTDTLDATKYDYVVFQEQVTKQASQPDAVIESIKQLSQLIDANGAQGIIYETICRGAGHSDYNSLKCSQFEMYQKIYDTLSKAGDAVGYPISRGGKATYMLHSQHPELTPFLPDLVHMTPVGSYLVALCHYATIFGESPIGAVGIDGLTDKQLQIVQQIAHDAVFDKTELTPIPTPDPSAPNITSITDENADEIYYASPDEISKCGFSLWNYAVDAVDNAQIAYSITDDAGFIHSGNKAILIDLAKVIAISGDDINGGHYLDYTFDNIESGTHYTLCFKARGVNADFSLLKLKVSAENSTVTATMSSSDIIVDELSNDDWCEYYVNFTVLPIASNESSEANERGCVRIALSAYDYLDGGYIVLDEFKIVEV